MFRIFPSFNKIIGNLQKINIHKKSFNNISKLYYKKSETLELKKSFFIDNIKSFEFHLRSTEIEKNKFIKNLKIKFSENEKLILIKADSGFGKSVLLNSMCGVLKSDCQYIINNKKYEENMGKYLNIFSYNSQNAPLLNDTILKNITFNEDEIETNFTKVENAIYISGLDSTIKNYTNKLQTLVSDRGHNFSGGQAQRLTLARTIYKNRKNMNENINERVPQFKKIFGKIYIRKKI